MSQAAAPPPISFVVITHNRKDDLERCLESIAGQKLRDREIIVVDHASTDGTLAMLSDRFPEARVLAETTNWGVSGGRNRGAMVAQGEIAVFLDDDAWFESAADAERILQYFQTRPRMACLALTILDADRGVEETKGIPRRDKRSLAHDYPCTYFCGAGFAVRRSVFLEAGMFWEKLVYGSQELDLSYRLLDRGHEIWHTASVRVRHRSAPTGRPRGQWIYFNTRDRPWVAAGHLPWVCVATTTALWWANTLWAALRTLDLGPYLRGIADCLVGLPAAVRRRRRIATPALQALRKLSGRLWY